MHNIQSEVGKHVCMCPPLRLLMTTHVKEAVKANNRDCVPIKPFKFFTAHVSLLGTKKITSFIVDAI